MSQQAPLPAAKSGGDAGHSSQRPARTDYSMPRNKARVHQLTPALRWYQGRRSGISTLKIRGIAVQRLSSSTFKEKVLDLSSQTETGGKQEDARLSASSIRANARLRLPSSPRKRSTARHHLRARQWTGESHRADPNTQDGPNGRKPVHDQVNRVQSSRAGDPWLRSAPVIRLRVCPMQ